MFHSIRFKLIASLIAVSLLVGLISILVGGNRLYQSVLDEAHNRIRQDLNVARVIYDDRVDTIRMAMETIASTTTLSQAAMVADPSSVPPSVNALANRIHLDFLGITDMAGQVFFRAGNPAPENRVISENPLVRWVVERNQPIAGTVVLSDAQLRAEDPELAVQARSTMHASPLVPGSSDGLTIGAAVPIVADGRRVGVLYGGCLLNGDTAIVDKIGETVFKNEIYKGRHVGTATIFHNDLRVATSVKDAAGNRALGTHASPEVARRVLGEGKRWTDRAMVLADWYITAYEPLADIAGNRAGMLYVGVLENKYADIRNKAIAMFAGITLAGVLFAIVLSWLLTGRIMRPVSYLIRASAEISSGNLHPNIGPISSDDIGQLQKKFMVMVEALQERERMQRKESETRLIQSEKQASVGKLAAGVAHEINNPLTAVLTFTHLILRRTDLPEDVRDDLAVVAAQTERVRGIVKSLLDFSRQTELTPTAMDVNVLVEDSIRLMENQALIKGIDLVFKPDPTLPILVLDRNQCQSVLINMILNAFDAMAAGGRIEITTRNAGEGPKGGVEISIADTGSGILPDHLDKLFDPFFTTKPVGKGTGLGLAVSAGIIQRHGGVITVKSKPGSGATFTIWLPHRPQDGGQELPEVQS
ncbi:Histidine kinase [Desulfosarcina cetonica]|uniref:cache domain-containing protein n=1 Tax=Desulfosarcina cetonica TaxID=90730 RepID=UPI0006D1BF77|nr:cache domain-containing protein [Desulfosarcina cetonica]VTR66524.1 Histidine kinase [Desulfosarcina cetonica]